MQIGGVVFDLDGTLLDTLRDIAEAANAVLRSNGCPTHDVAAYRYFVGEGVSQLFQYILPEARRDASQIERCGAEFREQYEHHWHVHTGAYQGVDELLRELQSRSIPMAVLSNKPHPFTQKCVDRFLGAHSFAAVLGQREGVPRKPDPAGALEIAETLELSPSRFLYLGDTGVDMQTATRAGMYAVGALWGFREEAELKQNGACTLIDHPVRLLDVIDTLQSA